MSFTGKLFSPTRVDKSLTESLGRRNLFLFSIQGSLFYIYLQGRKLSSMFHINTAPINDTLSAFAHKMSLLRCTRDIMTLIQATRKWSRGLIQRHFIRNANKQKNCQTTCSPHRFQKYIYAKKYKQNNLKKCQILFPKKQKKKTFSTINYHPKLIVKHSEAKHIKSSISKQTHKNKIYKLLALSLSLSPKS